MHQQRLRRETWKRLGAAAVLGLAALAALGTGGCGGKKGSPDEEGGGRTISIVVMDPLAEKLACACVPGYAQRKYDRFGEALGAELNRQVELSHAENLTDILVLNPGKVHVVIGKRSVVEFDAKEASVPVRPVARLTDKEGSTTMRGLFVVRADDPAKTLADLKGRKILFGPPGQEERHEAALEALRSAGLEVPKKPPTIPDSSGAAVAVVEKKADAAIVSDYAMALLVGCGTIDKGALKVIGQTAAVDFVTVFVTRSVSTAQEKEIVDAFRAVSQDADLRKQMESAKGFVPIGRLF